MIRTNVELDEKLVKLGLDITNLKTKKELLNYALSELVGKKRRKKIIRFMGTSCWNGNLEETRRSRF